jgi:signal transduction histidine kinase
MADAGESRLAGRARALIVCVVGGAAAVAVAAAWSFAGDHSQLAAAAVLLALATAAEAFPAPVGRLTGHTSLSMAAIVPATILLGWQYGVAVAVLSVLLVEVVRRKEPARVLYNASMFALASGAAGLTAALFPDLGLVGIGDGKPVFVASLAYFGVNILLLMAVIVATGTATDKVVRPYLRATIPQFVVLGSMTAIFVELWTQAPYLIAFLAGPVSMIVIHQRAVFNHVERMQELDLEKDDFVAYASHELRTPIAVISGAARTIRHHGLEGERKEQMDDLIYDNAIRLEHLTEQLLDLNTINGGVSSSGVELNIRPVDVSDYLADLVRRLGLEGRVGVIAANSHFLVTDPDILDRVVGNLVMNSVRYGEDPITVTAYDNKLVVADCGKGVPAEFRQRMFKRFTRAGADRHPKGAGLGLALAAQYAELLGARISYEDVRPHGARFTVSLAETRSQRPSGSPKMNGARALSVRPRAT